MTKGRHARKTTPNKTIILTGSATLCALLACATSAIASPTAYHKPAAFAQTPSDTLFSNVDAPDNTVGATVVSRSFDRKPLLTAQNQAKTANFNTFTTQNGLKIDQSKVEAVSVSSGTNEKWGNLEKVVIVPEKSDEEKAATADMVKTADSSQKIYDDSNGAVVDENTRKTLKDEIDKARAIKDDVNQTVDMLKAHTASITKATDAVVASNTAYVTRQNQLRQQVIQQNYDDWVKTHPSSNIGEKIVAYASQFIGRVPYVWGGENPNSGMDCSGLVKVTFAHFGIYLPHFSGAQVRLGVQVPSLAQAKPGDIIGNNTHVGILSHRDANGVWWVVNAASPSEGIKYSPVVWAFTGPTTIARIAQ